MTLVVVLVIVLAAPGCRKKVTAPNAVAAGNHVAPHVARLYFEGPSMLLTAEPRNLQLSDSPAAALPVVVAELLKGPVNPALVRPFPPDVVLRGTYLLPDGTTLVDLGGATLSNGWETGSHEELMAIDALVQTIVTNFAEAKRVRILVNGGPAETLAGHIALDRALHPDPTVVDPRAR